jgi:hypothetical protein
MQDLPIVRTVAMIPVHHLQAAGFEFRQDDLNGGHWWQLAKECVVGPVLDTYDQAVADAVDFLAAAFKEMDNS